MAKQNNKTNQALEQRVVKFAEQVGRMVGTVQARAEGWVDAAALQSQLQGMREEASALLEQIAARVPAAFGKTTRRSRSSGRRTKGTKATADAKSRSGDVVAAPGKRHRKPAPSTPGIKHSDERIAKLRAANTLPRRSRD